MDVPLEILPPPPLLEYMNFKKYRNQFNFIGKHKIKKAAFKEGPKRDWSL
jgi:hypothetical protein